MNKTQNTLLPLLDKMYSEESAKSREFKKMYENIQFVCESLNKLIGYTYGDFCGSYYIALTDIPQREESAHIVNLLVQYKEPYDANAIVQDHTLYQLIISFSYNTIILYGRQDKCIVLANDIKALLNLNYVPDMYYEDSEINDEIVRTIENHYHIIRNYFDDGEDPDDKVETVSYDNRVLFITPCDSLSSIQAEYRNTRNLEIFLYNEIQIYHYEGIHIRTKMLMQNMFNVEPIELKSINRFLFNEVSLLYEDRKQCW